MPEFLDARKLLLQNRILRVLWQMLGHRVHVTIQKSTQQAP
jgi:hypothetical protein